MRLVQREQDVARPSMPPVLSCALTLWGVAACFITVLRQASQAQAALLSVGSATLLLCVLIAAVRLHRPLVISMVVGVALGGLCAGVYAYNQLGISIPTEPVSAVVILEEDAADSMFSPTAIAHVYGDDDVSLMAKVRLEGEASQFRYGDALSAEVSFSPPKEADRQRYWEEGVQANASLENVAPLQRVGVESFLMRARNAAIDQIESSGLDEETRAVLEALTCGYRTRLRNQPIYEEFKVAGLAHIVAVSGAHLAIVTALLGGALASMRMPRWLVIVSQGLFVGVFLLFAAAPVSAIRAAIMAWAALLSFVPHRRPASLNAIGICIMAILAVSPTSACASSFALSVGSTLGIVLFAPLMQAWFAKARLPRMVRESLAITMAASLLTVPYSACLFSQLPLISPLSNIVAAPLFSLACGIGLACALLAALIPPCAPIVLMAGSIGSKLLCMAVGAVSSIPYACVPFSGTPIAGIAASILLAVLLWQFWPRFAGFAVLGGVGAIACAAVCAAVVLPLVEDPCLVMLDVGQGDAFLLRDGVHTVLVDTGTNDGKLRQALARNHVVALDAVIITHGDDDHDGSLPALTQVAEVQSVLLAKDALSCPCKNCTGLCRMAIDSVGENKVFGLSKGDIINCGRIELRVVSPERFLDQGGNADSLVLRLAFDAEGDGNPEASGLLVGDVENEQLRTLIDRREIDNVDIYKVGHHGSKAAISEGVAETLRPSISLVSVGEGNRYGHPADSTIGCLEAVGSRVFRTDLQGDVTCRFRGGSIEVRTQR